MFYGPIFCKLVCSTSNMWLLTTSFLHTSRRFPARLQLYMWLCLGNLPRMSCDSEWAVCSFLVLWRSWTKVVELIDCVYRILICPFISSGPNELSLHVTSPSTQIWTPSKDKSAEVWWFGLLIRKESEQKTQPSRSRCSVRVHGG